LQTTFVDSTNICVDFLFVNLNYHKLIFKFPYFSGAYKTSYKYIGKREKSVIFNTVIYQSNNKHAKVRYKISISIDHIWAHVAFFLIWFIEWYSSTTRIWTICQHQHHDDDKLFNISIKSSNILNQGGDTA